MSLLFQGLPQKMYRMESTAIYEDFSKYNEIMMQKKLKNIKIHNAIFQNLTKFLQTSKLYKNVSN